MRAALYRFIPPRGETSEDAPAANEDLEHRREKILRRSLLRPEQLRRDRRHDLHALDEVVDGDILV
jgi:hypothetical protein